MANEPRIGEFERGPHPSDGEISCDTYCGAEGHVIRKGAPVYYKLSNVEYGEWRPVCRKHAIEETNIQY